MPEKIKFDASALKTLAFWINERESIRIKKEDGKPRPWTKDEWLRDHRWCNVRRMDDKVSQWLAQEWYHKAAPLNVVVVAAVLARMFNWPATLHHITGGKPLRAWDKNMADWTRDKLEKYKATGHKVFTGVYIINGAQGGSKISQVMRTVGLAYECGSKLIDVDSMETTWQHFQALPGVGSFIAGQIVADLRHVVDGCWDDHMSWAPIGPGSRRGMRRMLGNEAAGSMSQAEFNKLLPILWDRMMAYNTVSDIFEYKRCEAMDLQNCLCEFDKYMRLRYEGGHVRNKYAGMP